LSPRAATPSGRVFFAAAALFSIVLVWLDARVTAELLERVAAVATLDAGQLATPVAPGARERSGALLPGALDAKWYAIHAESLLRGEAWRVRSTALDNAPHGRDVHWASLLVWSLAGWAGLLSFFSGRPAVEEVQQAALSFGLVSFAVMAAAFAAMVWRRFGPATAGVALLMVAGSFPVYDMFRSGEVDHHGVAAFFCMACVFALAAGGAGFGQPGSRSPRRWFIASGVSGGLGLWASASTTLPVIVACGLGAVLGLLVVRSGDLPVIAWPQVWWSWAVAGAATSLVCYLVEYFPSGLGWRLEVNHPLYALAWLGGGWILALLSAWSAGRKDLTVQLRVPWPRGAVFTAGSVALALSAVAAPLLVLRLAGASVFAVSDPFLLRLHGDYIREFAPAWTAHAGPGWPGKLFDLAWWPALGAVLVSLLGRRRRSLPAFVGPALAVPVTAVAVAQAEALWQVRWTGLASGLWIVLVAVASGLLFGPGRPAMPGRRGWQALAGLFFLGLVPAIFSTGGAWFALRDGESPRYPKSFVPSLLLRDISHRIIRARPGRVPVVLSDPTSSTDLAFYGGIPVIGTLYWENNEGLKRAARIFSARNETELRRGLAGAGIGFIVLPTWDAFADLTAYSPLLRAGGEDVVGPGRPFLAGVIDGQARPDWLRPVHYPIPSAFGLAGEQVHIFEFVPDQTPFAARRARGLYEFERGDYAAAVKEFEAALALQSDDEIRSWLPALRQRVRP
jgi:hypothetical protein